MFNSNHTGKKKRKFTVSERKSYVSNFLKSGLSKMTYCQQQRISTSALYRWLEEFGTNKTSSNSSFIQVKVSKDLATHEVEPIRDNMLRLKLGNIELSIPSGFNIPYLSQLLQGLQSC